MSDGRLPAGRSTSGGSALLVRSDRTEEVPTIGAEPGTRRSGVQVASSSGRSPDGCSETPAGWSAALRASGLGPVASRSGQPSADRELTARSGGRPASRRIGANRPTATMPLATVASRPTKRARRFQRGTSPASLSEIGILALARNAGAGRAPRRHAFQTNEAGIWKSDGRDEHGGPCPSASNHPAQSITAALRMHTMVACPRLSPRHRTLWGRSDR